MSQPEHRARWIALAEELAAATTEDEALEIMRRVTGLTITDPEADRAELDRRVGAGDDPEPEGK